MSKGIGLDVGTNLLVAASMGDDGVPIFRQQRDCFLKVIPKTEVNKSSIRLSLDKRGANYLIDEDGSFIIVGENALEIAIERNDTAQRPMAKGVISPKEKASLPMLKLIIESLIGKGSEGDRCIYSVPAKPIDNFFDIMYHTEMMRLYINQMGFIASPINEAYAISLSELLDEGLTGAAISFGAGMTNICVVHEGDPLIEFSLTRGGDYIDQSVANALDLSSSLVQMEKEAGTDLYNPSTKIMEAVAVYYSSLMSYVFQNIAYELKQREKELPMFRDPVPVVFAGGLSLASGFIKKAEDILANIKFPIKVGELKLASDPLRTVANGALLASML